MFRRLLLPALNIKKTLGYTVLLPPKNLSCVTNQFCQITTGTGIYAKNSKNSTEKAVKEKTKTKKYITNRIHPAQFGKPTRPNFALTKNIPGYFCNPEELTLDGYKLIEKTQLEEVTEGFNQSTGRYNYIMPEGNVSREAEDKENADYIVSKKTYIDKSDAKKRVRVIIVECKNPDLEHSKFKTHMLIYHYLLPKGDPTKVPDVTKKGIRTVKPIKDLKDTLERFAKTNNEFRLISKNDKGIYVHTDNMNVDIVAGIQFNEYNHIDNNNIKALNMRVKAFSGAKELKKLENFGFLQVYSKEKQVLFYIDDVLAKMKTLEESDSGDFSIRTFENIEKDKSLKEVHRNKKKEKYCKVEESFKPYYSLKVRPSQPELVCQKYHFVSTQKPITDYHVWEILKTTDKELKPFIGKCLVQKVEKIHQTITTPDDVFKFMCKNFDFGE